MGLKELAGKVVVIISNEAWGKMRFIKHNYATAISKYTNVYFINPASSYNPKNILSKSIKEEIVEDNIHVLTYNNRLPNINYKHPFFKYNDRHNSKLIRKHIDQKHKGKEIIIWQFDIFRFMDMPAFEDAFRIYHACDPYEFVPTDKILPLKSDLIVYTSDNFADNYKQYNKPMLHIPHGIFEHEKVHNITEVERIKEEYGRFMLFAGTVYYVTDLELTIKMVEAFPDINLVLCGRLSLGEEEQKLWDKLLTYDNVFYLGTLPVSEMNNYIKAAEICLVVYTQWHVNRFPNKRQSLLKFTSYISQKKPTLSTQRSEMDMLQENTIYFADNNEEFIQKLSFLLSLPEEERVNKQLIDEYLDAVSYENLISKVLISIP